MGCGVGDPPNANKVLKKKYRRGEPLIFHTFFGCNFFVYDNFLTSTKCVMCFYMYLVHSVNKREITRVIFLTVQTFFL